MFAIWGMSPWWASWCAVRLSVSLCQVPDELDEEELVEEEEEEGEDFEEVLEDEDPSFYSFSPAFLSHS